MYTTILWDLDNTLLNFDMAEKYAFYTAMEHAGLTANEELRSTYSKINSSYWKMLERGEITKDALLRQRFAAFFDAVNISGVDVEVFRTDYQQLLGSVYYYMEDSLTLCKELKKTHHQYIVTNGVASTQRNRMKLSELELYTDGLFISEELGCEKPALEFFQRAFAQIPGFKKEETIIVGDSLSSDIKGGIGAGIACCWYNPKGLPAPADMHIDYTISHLRELLPIVGL